MIAFSCTCGHKYQVPEKYAGKKVRCKHCNEIVQIPLNSLQEEEVPASTDAQTESSTSEYRSNRMLWVVSTLLVLVVCVGFGSVIYTQHSKDKEKKALCTTCEIIVEEAETLTTQKEYNKALEKYLTVEKLISNSEFDSPAINYLLGDAEEKIQTLKSKMFANLHLPELNEVKKEADAFFSNGDFDSASEKYDHIVEFINTNQKQEDFNFKSLFIHSQKRVNFPQKLKSALGYSKNDLSKLNRTEVNKLYVGLIKELSSLRNSSDDVMKTIARLEYMSTQANAYYDEIEKQLAIAKREEEKKRIAEQKKRVAEQERRLAAERLREQEKLAESNIKKAAETLVSEAKEIVKASLKSPSTASFENTKYSVYKKDSVIRYILVAELDSIHGEYSHYSQLMQKYPDGVLLRYSGDVNAHNSYGAMIQNSWYCTVFYSPSQYFCEIINYDIQ